MNIPKNRFTVDAYAAIVAAEAIAGQAGHEHVGTEHMLLAIIDDPNPEIEHLLAATGIPATRIRCQFANILRPGENLGAVDLPAVPRLEHALQRAYEIAQPHLLPAQGVDMHHILLALAEDQESVAYQLLCNAGLTPDKIQQHVPRGYLPDTEEPWA